MAPILIDHRGLVKIGFIAVSTAVLIFVSGFFSGYQRASVIYQAGSEQASLALPDIVASTAADIEQQKPEVIAAGEKIDVDRPAETDEVITTAISTADEKNSGSVIYGGSILNGITDKGDIKNSKDNAVSEKEKNTAVNGYNQVNHIIAKEISTFEISSAQILAADSYMLKKINYSIQVGTYGRLANAENMVRKLQAQNLHAYVSEHSSKKNKILYNVRFGYFVDKKKAVSALLDYKSNQTGDGYLVKLTVNDTATTAEAEAIKKLTTIEQSDNDISHEPISAPISSDASQEKISQLEILNASAALKNKQTNIITN
jgi:cell division septation protein DedD